MLFLKARAIAALSAKDSDTIYRLAQLENWRKAARKGVNSTYFAVEDAERTLGIKFSDQQIATAKETFANPAHLEIEEPAHAE